MFICDNSECPNVGIVYNFGEDAPVRAECGGCKAVLLPQPEEQ